jgi:hypothetical protein
MTVLDWIKRIKRRPRPTGGPQPQVTAYGMQRWYDSGWYDSPPQ